VTAIRGRTIPRRQQQSGAASALTDGFSRPRCRAPPPPPLRPPTRWPHSARAAADDDNDGEARTTARSPPPRRVRGASLPAEMPGGGEWRGEVGRHGGDRGFNSHGQPSPPRPSSIRRSSPPSAHRNRSHPPSPPPTSTDLRRRRAAPAHLRRRAPPSSRHAAPLGGKTRSVCRGGSRPPLSLLSWHRPPPNRCHVTPPHFPPQHSIAAFHPRRLIVESLVTIFGDHSFYAFTPPTSPTLSANILIAHVRVRARSSRNAKHSFAFLYQRTHPLPCPRGEL